MDPKIRKKLYDKINRYADEMIELQKGLTAIPAIAPESEGTGESEKFAFLEKWIAENIGFDAVKHYDAPDKRVPSGVRPNVAAIIKGSSKKRKTWVMAHLDIVPPGDLSKWDSDPYKVVVKDGKVYGRGTEDNQHGIVTPLFALKAIKEAGVNLPYDAALALVSDEETGSKFGIEYMIQKCDMFGKDDYIFVPDAGDPKGSMIEVAEKSIYWLKFETRGVQCHASTPKAGVNAHFAAAHLITRLSKLYQIFNRKDKVFSPPMSTFEATKKLANVPNINTIPGDDVFFFDMRILPGIPLSDVDAEIRRISDEVEKKFKVKISFSAQQREAAAPPTPVDAPVVKALAAAIKDVYHIKARPMGIGGGTVAAYFRRNGFNAVVWSRIQDTCHSPNEFTTVDGMIGDTKVFANIFLQE